MVQAAFRDQLTTLAVDFHQQCFSSSIDETHGTEIHVKLLARRGRVKLPPTLLERGHPGPRQPALDGKKSLSAFLLGCNSQHECRPARGL